jgi:23S rRNA (guanine745-N1)-methyltransferase
LALARCPLQCLVRGCARPLTRRGRSYVCEAGHSYDVARSGYVNLLQPQDRRSPTAGDSGVAVDARASLLAHGIGRTLIEAIASRASSLDLGESPVIVDLGCGSGDALAALSEERTGVGIDISTAAIDRAARRFPDRTWVVANADRRLPLLDGSVDLVLSVHGRRNPPEVARVLRAGRYLVVAIPAADDLIELREMVQGTRVERDRVSAVVIEHEPLFEVLERAVVREMLDLDRGALLNLLQGTYRGVRRAAAERVDALTRMTVTLASDLLVFRLR